MIPCEFKRELLDLIEEAHASGAKYCKACEVVGISERTVQRWKQRACPPDRRKGSEKRVARKLTKEQKDEIEDVCSSPRYRDKNPHQIVPHLLNEGVYLASVSTIYRVLKERDLLHHRSNRRVATKRSKPPERQPQCSNQVWCWGITWLAQRVKGLFYFAYVIMDIFDKSIVGWSVHESESDEHARALFEHVSQGQNIRFENLHSDNGNPMKGVTLMALLESLKVSVSFSRPRVSNDNPFIESLFRTLKYHPGYPLRFDTLEAARLWMADFVNWYNTVHLHSTIGYVTPLQMRNGEAVQIFEKRNQVMEEAKAKFPERWGSRRQKLWQGPEMVVLNPVPAA
ncbi:MAG: IS3 family transposase [Candidatus Marinimicrobia bacterium]|nr:IS3 family transposase [Candidatus Neomarinimicrobiota bacterium]